MTCGVRRQKGFENMDEESKDLEARIAYLEENVIKDDIDNRGIPIPVMSKKDYMALKNEELDGSELNVIIDEDNMKLQNITIESEKNPLLIKK